MITSPSLVLVGQEPTAQPLQCSASFISPSSHAPYCHPPHQLCGGEEELVAKALCCHVPSRGNSKALGSAITHSSTSVGSMLPHSAEQLWLTLWKLRISIYLHQMQQGSGCSLSASYVKLLTSFHSVITSQLIKSIGRALIRFYSHSW